MLVTIRGERNQTRVLIRRIPIGRMVIRRVIRNLFQFKKNLMTIEEIYLRLVTNIISGESQGHCVLVRKMYGCQSDSWSGAISLSSAKEKVFLFLTFGFPFSMMFNVSDVLNVEVLNGANVIRLKGPLDYSQQAPPVGG
jgi:hypothetical protein